jgi:hypothetical protein
MAASGEDRRDVVYRWVGQDEDPIARPVTLPALRVCADALIDWTAAARKSYPEGLLALRVGALYAWPFEEIPNGIAPPPQARLVCLKVDSNIAFVGDMSALDDVLTIEAWSQALSSLREYGAATDQVEEELGFVLSLQTHMRVEAGHATIASLPTALREGLLRYFADPIHRYLGSLQALTDFRKKKSANTAWEVVLPAARAAGVTVSDCQ